MKIDKTKLKTAKDIADEAKAEADRIASEVFSLNDVINKLAELEARLAALETL
jgi:hypothetical protein